MVLHASFSFIASRFKSEDTAKIDSFLLSGISALFDISLDVCSNPFAASSSSAQLLMKKDSVATEDWFLARDKRSW